ncbi:zinc finger protein 490-like isoform X2 [Toxorhynchites rutilus septentrionalis]|uniref:zinc finger protein 490-like isoform X2 n=1 Tax=Toxorhynchites rutilus septentrionalis TaxID=329112 RepID=UPI0024795F16|nr:zinc finger protein 490-like isoform X2 [Toxorhynchites rutilus septentrionalis]
MAHYCAVHGCGTTRLHSRNTDFTTTVHGFPTNESRLSHWIGYCGKKKGWKPQANQGICAKHFAPYCYIENTCSNSAKRRRKLNADALPGDPEHCTISEVNANQFTDYDKTWPEAIENVEIPVNISADDCRLDTTEECYDEEMIVEKLEDSDDEIFEELKIEPTSVSSVKKNIKEELDEEPVELPLPQVEIITNPLDIPIEGVNSFCRLCLREIPNLFPLMSRIQNVLVPEMFYIVTGININFRDKLPKKVCINCLIRLDYAYNIRKDFLDTHRTLKSFSLTRIQTLLEHLQNYQKGIRLTTESYGEKILRQHKDIIRMRLIKKQEHLEKQAGNEVLEEITKNMPVEKFMAALVDKPLKVERDSQRPVDTVDLETVIDLEESNEQSEEERIEEGKMVETFIYAEEVNLEPEFVEAPMGVQETDERPVFIQRKRQPKRVYNIDMKDTKPDPNKCYICDSVFPDTDALDIHLPDHVDMLPYSCDRCVDESGQAKQFTSLILLHRHFRMHAGSIRCPIASCPIQTFTRVALYAHMSNHHRADSKTKYTCEICGHQLENRKRFHKHMRSHKALDDGRYPCSHCDKKFDTKTRMTRHERSHTQERPYKCRYCEKTFTNETSLHGHERTHTGEKGFRCDTCGKRFRSRYCLNDHIAVAHEGLTRKKKPQLPSTQYPKTQYPKSQFFAAPRKCQVEGCDFSTTNRAKHYNHLARHTLKFHCAHCPKRFPSKQSLDMHEYIHDGVKRFCCEQCGKSFRFRNSLVEHMDAHKNVRPWACDVCGKAFVRERTLKEHRWKHSDTLNYKCRICDKKFKYRADQSKHERTHTEAETDRTAFQFSSQGDMDLIVEVVETDD